MPWVEEKKASRGMFDLPGECIGNVMGMLVTSTAFTSAGLGKQCGRGIHQPADFSSERFQRRMRLWTNIFILRLADNEHYLSNFLFPDVVVPHIYQ